jgi:hypothetical protein
MRAGEGVRPLLLRHWAWLAGCAGLQLGSASAAATADSQMPANPRPTGAVGRPRVVLSFFVDFLRLSRFYKESDGSFLLYAVASDAQLRGGDDALG